MSLIEQPANANGRSLSPSSRFSVTSFGSKVNIVSPQSLPLVQTLPIEHEIEGLDQHTELFTTNVALTANPRSMFIPWRRSIPEPIPEQNKTRKNHRLFSDSQLLNQPSMWPKSDMCEKLIAASSCPSIISIGTGSDELQEGAHPEPSQDGTVPNEQQEGAHPEPTQDDTLPNKDIGGPASLGVKSTWLELEEIIPKLRSNTELNYKRSNNPGQEYQLLMALFR